MNEEFDKFYAPFSGDVYYRRKYKKRGWFEKGQEEVEQTIKITKTGKPDIGMTFYAFRIFVIYTQTHQENE